MPGARRAPVIASGPPPPFARAARLTLALALTLTVLGALAAVAWWRLPAARHLRARALVASTPAWIGQGTLSGPGFTLPLTVRWQRPGWWRVESPAGDSAYDGRSLTVRLPGGAAHAVPASAAAANAWPFLWPAAALRRPGPVTLDARGWPVAWQTNGLQVRYTRVTPVPPLPRADFRVNAAPSAEPSGAAAAPGAPRPTTPPPALTPARLGFTPRPVPGLRPLWTAAYNLPGQGPVAVFAYTLQAGTLTIAEQPGSCPAADPTWVRTESGWLVHWCAGRLQFTGDGPDDRAAIAAIVRGLS